MPAWNATRSWAKGDLDKYRQFVNDNAPHYKGATQDCADLSMSLLIDFAASEKLPVTFTNDDRWVFSSRADSATQKYYPNPRFPTQTSERTGASWTNKDEFKQIVWAHINVRDLWYHNTYVAPYGRILPAPGDLLLIFEKGWLLTHRHHSGLVFRAYAPGQAHPREKDRTLPDFPGGERAMSETSVTEYFRGDTFGEGRETFNRRPDSDWHFDYLNSRGDAKRNAELIYFANYTDFRKYGFEFRIYTDEVLQ